MFIVNLKEIRKSSGMSLNQLSLESGVGKATISDIENYKCIPTIRTAWLLCVVLGVSLDPAFPLRDHKLMTELLQSKGVEIQHQKRYL